MEQDDRRVQHTIKFLYRLCARSESSYARYGLILPFDRAIQEFYTPAKAPSPVFAPGINHSSYLRKLTRRGGNKRFFARAPGPLADYAGTVGTDVFRNRSFTDTGFSKTCEVDGNRRSKALFKPAIEKSFIGIGSLAMGRTVHYLLPRGEVRTMSFKLTNSFP